MLTDMCQPPKLSTLLRSFRFLCLRVFIYLFLNIFLSVLDSLSISIKLITLVDHHHHHQFINVPTAGAQSCNSIPSPYV
jgi:hypothetical protein